MSNNDETTIREAQSSSSPTQPDENATPTDTQSTPPVRRPTGPQPTDNVEPH